MCMYWVPFEVEPYFPYFGDIQVVNNLYKVVHTDDRSKYVIIQDDEPLFLYPEWNENPHREWWQSSSNADGFPQCSTDGETFNPIPRYKLKCFFQCFTRTFQINRALKCVKTGTCMSRKL